MKNHKPSSAKRIAKTALSSVLAISAISLAGCGKQNSDPNVECYGVSKFGPDIAVVMPKGICEKIAGGKAVAMDANNYVECYGVAAAGKNDCATNSTACGGTAAADHLPQAWIAIPQGICAQLAGAKIGAITKAGTSSASTSTSASQATAPNPKKSS